MRKHIAWLFLLGLFLTLATGGCSHMSDRATPSPNAPQIQTRFYPVGRFILPVPVKLDNGGASDAKIDEITVKELPWRTEEHQQEWNTSWRKVWDEAKKEYDENAVFGPELQGGIAQQDVSPLIGKNAALLCYENWDSNHILDVFIQDPQLLLRFSEARFFELGTDCSDLDISKTVAPLYKSYRYGRSHAGPDSFFTTQGRFEGLRSKDETCRAGFVYENGEMSIRLSFAAYTSPSPDNFKLRSISTVSSLARQVGAKLTILRSRRHDFNGQDGLEEVYTVVSKDSDGDVQSGLTCSLRVRPEANSLEKPYISIELIADTALQDEALAMWEAIMSRFTTVRAFYSGNVR